MQTGFERSFLKGNPPTERNYPGLGYRRSRENGKLIERDVAGIIG